MTAMFEGVKHFVREDDGAVAIEYALLAALIALAITVGATALGNGISAFFSAVAAKLATYVPAT